MKFTQDFRDEVTQDIADKIDKAYYYVDGTANEANISSIDVDGNKIEVWFNIPEDVTEVEKREIVSTSGSVIVTRDVPFEKTEGRALTTKVTMKVRRVVE